MKKKTSASCPWTVFFIWNLPQEMFQNLNSITPRSSDKHVTSPHNVHTFSSRQVMRKDKLISQKALS